MSSKARKSWEPNPELVPRETAVRLISTTSAKGFTRKFLNSIGVPWPPPPKWKKRLCEACAVHYKKTLQSDGNLTLTGATVRLEWATDNDGVPHAQWVAVNEDANFAVQASTAEKLAERVKRSLQERRCQQGGFDGREVNRRPAKCQNRPPATLYRKATAIG